MEMRLIAHQKAVRQVWTFWQYSLRQMTKYKHTSLFRSLKECASRSFCGWSFRSRSRMRRALMAGMPSSGACSLASRLGLWPMDPKTRTLLSGVRTEDGRTSGFLHATVFFTPLPCASTDCFWKWGFLSINFMAKSALCLNHGPRPKRKKSHSTPHTHTRSLTPQLSKSTNF